MREMVTRGAVIAALLSLGTPLHAQQRTPRPVAPYVQRGVCPFECCHYGPWRATSGFNAYTREGGRTRAFVVRAGTKFLAEDGSIHFSRLGRVVAQRAIGTGTRSDSVEVSMQRGDTLIVLSYLGEGYYSVWWRGRRYDGVEGFWADPRKSHDSKDAEGLLVSEPRGVWWVRAKFSGGRTAWIRMDEAAVRDNDSCA